MPATDDYASLANVPAGSYRRAAAIAPNDGADLSNVTRAIFVGGAGNIALVTEGGDSVTITGVVAGQILPIQASRVKATGTTATNMVALW